MIQIADFFAPCMLTDAMVVSGVVYCIVVSVFLITFYLFFVSVQGPKGENVGSITQPLPSNYLIFRAASESDGRFCVCFVCVELFS